MATKKRSDYDLATAEGALQAYMDRDAAVGDYVDPYANDVKNALAAVQGNKYTGYNAGTDPTYAAYAKQFKQNAEQSARDSYGRATATSGGYANSYAQRVSQQAYDDTMAKLGQLVPQLAEADYNRYRAEQSDRYDLLAALQGASDREYNRWADADQRARADAADLLDLYYRNRDLEYQKQRDAVADEQWAKEYALSAAARASSGSGSGSGSRSSGSGSGSGNGGGAASIKDYDTLYKRVASMTGEDLWDEVITMNEDGLISDSQVKQMFLQRGVPSRKIDEFIHNKGKIQINGVWKEWKDGILDYGTTGYRRTGQQA